MTKASQDALTAKVASAHERILQKANLGPDDVIVCTLVHIVEDGVTLQASSAPTPALAAILLSVAQSMAQACGMSMDQLTHVIAEAKADFNSRN